MAHRSLPVLFGTAGISWTAAQTTTPDMGATTDMRLEAVAASPEMQSLSTALLAVAAIFFVLSAISLAQIPLHGRGARLIRIGGMMLGIGGIWLAAGRAGFSLSMLQLTSGGVSRESAVAALSADPGIAFLAILPTLPALLLGPVLIGVGIGLHANRLSGWLPLMCWIAGIGIFIPSEFTNKLGEGVGIGLASLALVLASIAVARIGRESTGTTLMASSTSDADQPTPR